jgi:hypothetical protein
VIGSFVDDDVVQLPYRTRELHGQFFKQWLQRPSTNFGYADMAKDLKQFVPFTFNQLECYLVLL